MRTNSAKKSKEKAPVANHCELCGIVISYGPHRRKLCLRCIRRLEKESIRS